MGNDHGRREPNTSSVGEGEGNVSAMTLKGLCVLITQRANHYVNTCRDGNSVSLKQSINILDNFRC